MIKNRSKDIPRKIHLKKGDFAYVISGKDKGKTGQVLRVLPKSGRVIIEGINMTTKHIKPNSKDTQGKIEQIPFPIYSCKAMLYSKKHGVKTRISKKILEDGTKVRILKKYDEIL